MSIVAAVASGVIAAVAAAFAVLLMRHCDKAPQRSHPWIRRFCIILMWAAGSVLAATGLEGLLQQWTGDVEGFLAGPFTPIVHTVIVIGALFLVAGTIVALIWSPDDQAAMTALLVPLILGLVAGGVLHELYAVTAGPGQQLASSLNIWLAG